ncbi:RidA family protein [Halopseudomonas bauzanensis]|uniref:RidA family protein n=1 Tax=Halopseudomonas bauzanensis TaxID=653930 RepID=A0A4U0YJG3_9GAMM|nr:RidA family protein [Halopseudomonas bauzanensis]TKA89844.1 RidA family protein [Halopseudomonas bauzanensis]
MNIQPLYTKVLMSQVLVHQNAVYLAGRFADAIPAENDLDIQAGNTLAAIEQVLAEAGSDKTRLLSATIYLKDIQADVEQMDRIWGQWLPEGVVPVRAALEAERVQPDVLVEIAMVAAL